MQPEKFIGPLPLDIYKQAAEDCQLVISDLAVEVAARAMYGQKLAELALAEANRDLDNRRIDTLSGLLTRHEWSEQASRKIYGFQYGQRSADRTNGAVLLKFDAEKFKTINDTLGHPEGDRRISIIGDYLNKTAREGDLLGRLGGDEFVWLAPYDSNETNGLTVLLKIEDRLRDLVEEQYPDLPYLRWNHAFYEAADRLDQMLERSDVKGEAKLKVRSHSQSPSEYLAALQNAGISRRAA